jgi:hypothetical protein
MLENLQQQQLLLLARKALLKDELEGINAQLAQIAAVTQFAQNLAPQPEPEAAPEE